MSKHRTMSFISTGIFWGMIIILLGLSIILKEIFHINIPFVRVIFGMILIYWGMKMIVGGFWRTSDRNAAVFGNAKIDYVETQGEYSIVFGSGNIDLFKMEKPLQNKKIKVNVVFGDGTLIINDSIPMKIEMNTVFGASIIPDKRVNAFGKNFETTSAFREGEPYILLETNVVFGRLEMTSKKW